MSAPLLVEFFNALPEDAQRGGMDWPASLLMEAPIPFPSPNTASGKARRRAAIHVFCKQVQERYLEGTLLRLLCGDNVLTRRAAAFALGLLGTSAAIDGLTDRLRDEEANVAEVACESLWMVWFRGNNPIHSDELYRLLRTRDYEKALNAVDSLIVRAPKFIEAHHQRAILNYKLKRFDRAVVDCKSVIRLNPRHFAAFAVMGQSYLQLRRHKAALRAFRQALRIHPRLGTIADTVKTLEQFLGEEGR